MIIIYFLYTYYSISYCQEHGNCDPGKDPLDKLVERVKINTDNIINDIKQKVDEISAEAWTNIQESILEDKTKEAIRSYLFFFSDQILKNLIAII